MFTRWFNMDAQTAGQAAVLFKIVAVIGIPVSVILYIVHQTQELSLFAVAGGVAPLILILAYAVALMIAGSASSSKE